MLSPRCICRFPFREISICRILLLLVWGCISFQVKAIDADTLEMRIRAAQDEGRVVDDLGAAFSQKPSGEFLLLPANKNFRYGILIYQIDIFPDKAVFSAGMAFRDGHSNRLVAFSAEGVQFYYNRGLAGAVTLRLLNEVEFNIGNYVNVTFETGNPGTRVMMGCRGMESFTLTGRVSCHQDLIHPLNSNLDPLPDSTLVVSFSANAKDWDDVLLQVSFPAFGVKGLQDFAFRLEQLTLDLSQNRSAQGMLFHPSDVYATQGRAGEWEGLYLGLGEVYLPRHFTSAGNRAGAGVNTFYIDDRGVTGEIFGRSVLSPEKGNIGGWSVGIDEVRISLIRSGLESASLVGRLGLPVLPDTQMLGFKALIGANDNYNFRVDAGSGLVIPAFRVAKLALDPVSRVEMTIERGKVGLLADLTGNFSILQREGTANADGSANLPGLYVQGFRISNQAPKFAIGYLGPGRNEQGRVNGFPVYVSDLKFNAAGESASIAFILGVNLKEKISGDAGMEILARITQRNGRDRAEFEKLRLNHVRLDAQFSAFSFSGVMAFIRKDSVYGEGFNGKISFSAELPPGKISGGTMILFGSVRSHRYWYFDAELALSQGVPVGPGVSINGFLGGAWHGMRVLRTGERPPSSPWGISTTGRTYVPDATSGLGLRAGVYVQGAGKGAFQANAVLEMQFFKAGGLDKVMLYGGADFMTAGAVTGAQDFRQRTTESCRFTTAEDFVAAYRPTGKLSAALMIQLDFKNRVYFGDLGIYVNNGSPGIRGTGNSGYAGKASLYFSPTDWYVWIGNSQRTISLEAGLGKMGNLTIGAYLMAGTRVLAPPPLPAQVAQLTGMQHPEPSRDEQSIREGVAFAYGGQMSVRAGAEYQAGAWRLYALGTGQAGFDVNLKRISQVYTCKSTGKVPGINGWYADGRWYAGLNIRLGGAFRQFKVDVANISAAALFNGQGPDPFYANAEVRVRVKLAFARLDAGMNFELGEPCELIRTALSEKEFITLAVPVHGAREVTTLIQPQVQYAYPVNRAFRDAGGREFRFLADQPKLRAGRIPTGRWQSDTAGMNVTYVPDEPFAANSRYEVYCKVVLQARNPGNGRWETLMQSGKPVGEEKTFEFHTGNPVQMIPESNVAVAWPASGQVNFYRSVSATGLIRLKTPQPALFSVAGTRVVARFTSSASDIYESEARLSGNDITFSIPGGLGLGRVYRLRLVRQSASIPLQSGFQQSSVSARAPGNGSSVSFQPRTSPTPAPVMIYSCHFRVAENSLPSQQWAGMRQDSARFQPADGRWTAAFSHPASQYFEPAEWLNQPRIRPRLVLEKNAWFRTSVEPVLYGVYKQLGNRERTFIRFSRDTALAGLVPSRSLQFMQEGIVEVRLGDVHLTGMPFSFKAKFVSMAYHGLALMRSDLEDIRRGMLTYLQADPAADLKRLSALIPGASSPAVAIPVTFSPAAPVALASLSSMPASAMPVAVMMPVTAGPGSASSVVALRNELIARIQRLSIGQPSSGEVFSLSADYRSPVSVIRELSMWRMLWP